MDIQKKPKLAEKQAFWAEQLPNFESKYWLPSHFEFLAFDMDHGNYVIKDDLDPRLEDDANEIFHRVNTGWAMWKKAVNFTVNEAKASVIEGFVLVPKEPTLEMCHRGRNTRSFKVQDIYKAMIEAQEPAPLKLGDLVKPIDHRYTLASGCERYPYAYVVNTNPFQLMSEEGDMYWCCTVEAGGYKLIKSNDQLPEAVSLRMIREGLLSPVETQEQSHD